MPRKKFGQNLASSGLLLCIFIFSQCEPNSAVGGRSNHTTHITLDDAIVNGIQDDFLRDAIKKLKAGEKVDLTAAKPNGDDRTLHTLAISESQHSLLLLKYLHQQGLSPKAVGKYGRSALTTAAQSGHEDIVKYLLSDCKVDPDQPQAGERPLLNAIDSGKMSVVRLLLGAGANPNLDDGTGQESYKYSNDVLKTNVALRKILGSFVRGPASNDLEDIADIVQVLLNKGNGNVIMQSYREQLQRIYSNLHGEKKTQFRTAAQKRGVNLA